MVTDNTVLENMLVNYAAGSLNAAESFVIAMHLSLNAQSRQKVERLEAVGGAFLQNEAPANVSDDCLQKTLEKIDGCNDESPCTKALQEKNDLNLPLPLLHLLCNAQGTPELRWRKVTKQIDVIDINICPSQPKDAKLRLMRIHPGCTTPHHRHHGVEMTLVLDGAYQDEFGEYRRGDISIIDDPEILHNPLACPEQGCICLTLTEKRLRFKNPIYQILGSVLRF